MATRDQADLARALRVAVSQRSYMSASRLRLLAGQLRALEDVDRRVEHWVLPVPLDPVPLARAAPSTVARLLDACFGVLAAETSGAQAAQVANLTVEAVALVDERRLRLSSGDGQGEAILLAVGAADRIDLAVRPDPTSDAHRKGVFKSFCDRRFGIDRINAGLRQDLAGGLDVAVAWSMRGVLASFRADVRDAVVAPERVEMGHGPEGGWVRMVVGDSRHGPYPVPGAVLPGDLDGAAAVFAKAGIPVSFPVPAET